MVFAPTPLLTVTIEQRADRPDVHLHAGGQGVWQARMVTSLGVPVVMCAAIGGEVGLVLRPLLEREGVELRLVDTESSTGAYVHDRRGGERVTVAEMPTAPFSRHEMDELYGVALAEGINASVCVLSGPANPDAVPPDLYRRFVTDIDRNGGHVVADLSGEHLTAAVEAGGLRLLKLSHEELVSSGYAENDSVPQVVRAMFGLRERGVEAIVVSRAEEPALALIDEQVYEVVPPKLEPADHRGAGDSMTAGVAAVLAQGGDLSSAIRTGAAAGALNVTQHGLGTGTPDAIAQLVRQIELVPVDAPRRAVRDGGVTSPDELAEQARPR